MFDVLQKLFLRDKFPPVLLIEGVETGSNTELLHHRLCAMHYCKTKDACGSCSGCLGVKNKTAQDLLWFETEEKRIKIEDIAQIQDHISIKPATDFRVVVIVDVDKMTLQSVNRFLKTMEEPPTKVHIILTTNHIKSLLPTFISRCVKIKVRSSQYELDVAASMSQEVRQELQQILLSDSFTTRLSRLESCLQKYKLSPMDVAVSLEIILNQYYRTASHVDPLILRKRREIISQVKAFAGIQKITINSQLSAEGMTLSGR